MKNLFLKTLSFFSILLSVAAICFSAGNLGASNYYPALRDIKGIVTDKQTKEPLAGATVQVLGTKAYTIANADGSYTIPKLKPGSYSVKVSYIGYKEKTIGITIGKEDALLDFEMEKEAQTLDGVSVVARKSLENEKSLQMERMNSTVAIENMGAKEMSIKGAGNVQEGVKKITGISIASAGQLIVRGLGDRYSTTTLNGLPIASPNPDNKLIPLDLFPSSTVRNITVSKVYEASAAADYSGAHIDISTKENNDVNFFSIEATGGCSFNTIGKDFYHSDRKGSMFSTGNIRHKYLDMSLENFESAVKQKDVFGTDFSISKNSAVPDFSTSIGAGRTWKLQNNRKLSIMASAGINKSSQIMKDAYVSTLTAQGTKLNSFDYNSYTSTLKLAGLFNAGYSFKKTDRINYTFFYARNAIDNYMSRSGFDSEGVELLGSNSVFHAYTLLNNQIAGHHEFSNGKWRADWSGSYGMTGSDEPDRRQVMFRKGNDGKPTSLFTLNQQETMRYFGELNENDGVGNVSLAYAFDEKNLLRIGGSYEDKSRDFSSARFYYNLRNLQANVTTIYDTDDYLNFENIADGSISVSRNKQPRDGYKASHIIGAAFAEAEYYPVEKLLINLGIRFEQSRQTVDYYTDGGTAQKSTLEKGDFFPALNMRYAFNNEHSLRFSASRTITRPAFVEMAPFLYKESYGSASLRGNADLKNGYNINFDLRYDFFPKESDDMFSATGYFKILQNPIEQVQESEGGSAVHSFRNADDGIAAGVEIEIRKKIARNFRFGANGSFMYTNVTLPKNGGVYTDSQRALQGASPYLINADLSWSPSISEEGKIILALIYNLQGPRIQTVGIFGLGNIEQEPLHTLDFTGSYRINRHFNVKIKLRDILNSAIRFKQDVPDTGEKIAVESFKPGTSAEIGLSYQF